ncbi:MAG: GNAT family N-acetyltransferase [Chloracidobacterium sp.]|nr:GNAT family N-acetyltransferase [Chloracidobacterium sp.]
MIFSDIKLSQKLERTEARVNADFVETRARLESEIGAEWIEVAGTYAMFDGVESPLTQTFGLGLFEDATDEHLDEIEAFFNERKAPVFHEVSPMTDPSLMELLSTRGYRPIELTSVMFRELDRLIEKRRRNESLTTRVISSDEIDLWARTSADGWATEHEGLADFMFSFGRIGAQCKGAFPYLAELDGNPISTGSLFIYDDVCALAGASTIPAGRNQGAQTALLEDRLEFAAEKGCKLAIMGASPGSQSQKNAQKNGFKIAYTRTKWQLRV